MIFTAIIGVHRVRVREHVDGVSLHTYIDTHKYSGFFVSVGLASACPNYSMGGWFDLYLKEDEMHKEMSVSNPSWQLGLH
jgi:hypothetical protein